MQIFTAVIVFVAIQLAVGARIKSSSSDETILVNAEIDRCTSIAVGPEAGVDGPMNTHTADCANCDFRINKVPPMDWPEGAMRPLYLYKGDYPSTVSTRRGATWHPDNLEGTPEQLKAWGRESVITGYIPQVSFVVGKCAVFWFDWRGT